MTDVHNKETRSYNMSRIISENTKPEMIVRKYLHAKGLRYRLHTKELPGKPDIYFPKYKTAVEIRGCFWHGHENCKYFVIPKTRQDWWTEKISKTKGRDYKNEMLLLSLGIRTIVVWECALKNDKIQETLESLFNEITGENV
ncbi:DNA mismatch endonuclease Vsr [Chryseobacterium cucumeris]|uniref:Very short patch repair endonuclease n=1 Tax=Chryseobacterium cucumeris TaxID=1813611 RepID=A0ABX9X975_9FLAO|nr:DNA mismatch endonuclease Vsr [Chryseobacterium cucumeris]ROH94823.1 DNA mismatch endonuclease Vsr [Chryseobacterium cucumeris]